MAVLSMQLTASALTLTAIEQLLEVYALQIQMYTSQKDNKKLASIYEKALRTKSGVAHPVSGMDGLAIVLSHM